MGKRKFEMKYTKKKVIVVKTAVVDKTARIGSGTTIWHFSQIMHDACLGKDCIVGNGVFIDRRVEIGNNVKIMSKALIHRGVKIEDDCFIGPAACFINDKNPRSCKTRDISSPKWVIGKGASIGAGAIVLCDVNVGRYALVGAGAVVTKDVEAHGLVIGNPARMVGHVCYCGEKLKKTGKSYYCGYCRKYIKI